MKYADLLRDPRWQRKRLEIMQRDGFCCVRCGDTESTLNVDHLYYERGAAPWQYPPEALQTLCENCHALVTYMREEVQRKLKILAQGEQFFFVLDALLERLVALKDAEDPQRLMLKVSMRRRDSASSAWVGAAFWSAQ